MLKQLKTIWLAITLALMVFIALSVYMLNTSKEPIDQPIMAYNVQLAAIILLLIGLLITRYFSRKILLNLQGSLEEKFSMYRKVLIINLAVIEGIGFFSTVGYFVFGNSNLLLTALISLMLLLTYFPSVGRVARELGVSSEDISALKKEE